MKTLNVRHEKMLFTNDIVADGEGHLFVSDTQANAVFRVNVPDGRVEVFCESGLDAPNGMLLDKPGNRLLLVSFLAHSPIQAIDLSTAAVTTVRETNLSELDGIARTASGEFLVSSWASGAIVRFPADWSGEYEIVVDGLVSPADFFLDPVSGDLITPEMNANRLHRTKLK